MVETADVKAALATLSFIITSAAKHQCDSQTLSDELQQLGLPKGMWQIVWSGCDVCIDQLYSCVSSIVPAFAYSFCMSHIFTVIISVITELSLTVSLENATALCKAFGDNTVALQNVLRGKSLRCKAL